MGTACPECETDVELVDRVTHVRFGRCGHCGHELRLLSEERPASEAPAPDGEAAAPGATPAGATEAAEDDAAPLPCPSCGGELVLESARPDRLEAVCSDCDTEYTYVLRTGREERPARDERPTRSERPRREGREERDDSGPRSRPCRRCGEPLRFSTNEDGTVTGTCDACGNTFTLPPRTRPSWGGGARGGRYGGRGDRPRSGGYRPRERRGGSYGERRSYGGGRPDRRRRSRRDDE